MSGSAGNPLFWFEFLLNKDLLLTHLREGSGDPSATFLLTQFVQNANKWVDDTAGEEDALQQVSRAKKSRVLKKMALQTAAFLHWDLDTLSTLPMTVQHSLVKYGIEYQDENVFLKSLYHRWVLRSSQTPLKTNFLLDDPLAESVLRALTPDESVLELQSLLVKDLEKKPVFIPTPETFAREKPNFSIGLATHSKAFSSMMHLDIGIYLLYKGHLAEAVPHFVEQELPLENFPYLRITKEKLDGYLKALGLLQAPEMNQEDLDVGECKMVQIGKLVLKGDYTKLSEILDLDLVIDDSLQKPLDPEFIDQDEVDDTMFSMEKRLLETSDLEEIKELLIRLHAAAGGTRSFSKLFSIWEIPIPVQHGTAKILPGAFQDYIYILVAKSKQLLGIKLFNDSRSCLQLAQNELNIHIKTVSTTTLTQYTFNISKLTKMLEWEILLVDICQLFQEWPKQGADLVVRCKECLHCFKNQTSDVNPRSEIIENLLMALLNFGEFDYVATFDQIQQKWPFLDFLSLLARVCIDLVDRKDSSASYRELWHAVLPMFSTASAVRRQPAKPGILSSRSVLQWVIEKSKSHPLLQLFVSLFARLHNHITDDVGLQIQTDFLHIWPNILDDVTLSSDMKSRVSGSSKLNARQIRDVLFQLLKSSGPGEVMWLKCMGDVYLASGNPAIAMKCYLEYLAMSTDFFEKHSASHWNDNNLFRRMIKCSELMQAFTQAIVLCQFLTEVDYSMAFGMAQEKVTSDAGDSLYGFIWDLTVLEFLINLHTKRNEVSKRQQAMKIMGLMELNSNNNEEIQREAMHLRKSQFMRTLAKLYMFV